MVMVVGLVVKSSKKVSVLLPSLYILYHIIYIMYMGVVVYICICVCKYDKTNLS